MTQDKWMPQSTAAAAPRPLPGELNIDYRARLALLEREAVERRQLRLAEQVAVNSTPEQRVRVWERLHELPLPKNPSHPLIRIIAADTRLTPEQVREEQRRRLAPVSSSP